MRLAILAIPSDATAAAAGGVAARDEACLGLPPDQDTSTVRRHPAGAVKTQATVRAHGPIATVRSAMFLLSPRPGAALFGMESQ